MPASVEWRPIRDRRRGSGRRGDAGGEGGGRYGRGRLGDRRLVILATGGVAIVVLALGVGPLWARLFDRPRPHPAAGAANGRPQVHGRVVLAGDSLTVGELATLPSAATERGIDIEIAAQVGRTTEQGIAAATPLLDRPAALVVVALGTNDANADLTARHADDLIDAALAAIDPDTTVLWVDVFRADGTTDQPGADRFNLSLRRATARHPNLVIASWYAFVRQHPEVMAADGVHLTDAGYRARSGWLVEQIASRLPPA